MPAATPSEVTVCEPDTMGKIVPTAISTTPASTASPASAASTRTAPPAATSVIARRTGS